MLKRALISYEVYIPCLLDTDAFLEVLLRQKICKADAISVDHATNLIHILIRSEYYYAAIKANQIGFGQT